MRAEGACRQEAPSVERRRLQPQDRELGNQMHGEEAQSGSSGRQLTTGDEDRAGVALRGQWHISDSLLRREQKEALSSQGGFMNMVFTTESRNRVYNTHGDRVQAVLHTDQQTGSTWERHSAAAGPQP